MAFQMAYSEEVNKPSSKGGNKYEAQFKNKCF